MTEAPMQRDRLAPVLAARGIAKSFGGARALRGVDFTLHGGEVHALLGENGAGKTTLMNILSGAHAPDQGDLAIDGKSVRFADPREAQAAGIATIYQELDLVPSLDVAANLFLGHERLRHGFLDKAAMRDEARQRLAAIDLDIDIDRRVADLSIGHRQIVAIVKALSSASRVLIMDEPTAALNAGEVERLFRIMRDLTATGVGIIYISHRLEEVPRIADRVTVMRDGLIAGETSPQAPQAEIVQLLVGRPLGELYPRRAGDAGRRLLHLERARFRLHRRRAGWQPPEDITLSVHAGEIVGLAGIMGAGRTELLSALYGTGSKGRGREPSRSTGDPPGLPSIRTARRAASPSSPTIARRRADAAHVGRPKSPDVHHPPRDAVRFRVRRAGNRRRGTLVQAVRHSAARRADRRRRTLRRQPAESRAGEGSSRRTAAAAA